MAVLKTPVTYSDGRASPAVWPICLPPSWLNFGEIAGKNAVALGWGWAVNNYSKIEKLEELAKSNETDLILSILNGNNENYTLGTQNRLHEVRLSVDREQMKHRKMLSTQATGYRGASTADNDCESCRDTCKGDSGKFPHCSEYVLCNYAIYYVVWNRNKLSN